MVDGWLSMKGKVLSVFVTTWKAQENGQNVTDVAGCCGNFTRNKTPQFQAFILHLLRFQLFWKVFVSLGSDKNPGAVGQSWEANSKDSGLRFTAARTTW